jgi:hypothetical protein
MIFIAFDISCTSSTLPDTSGTGADGEGFLGFIKGDHDVCKFAPCVIHGVLSAFYNLSNLGLKYKVFHRHDLLNGSSRSRCRNSEGARGFPKTKRQFRRQRCDQTMLSLLSFRSCLMVAFSHLWLYFFFFESSS